MMERTHRPHEEATSEMIQRDPALAADYVLDALVNGDRLDLTLALRSVSAAFDGIPELAHYAEAPNMIYRMLRRQVNHSLTRRPGRK